MIANAFTILCCVQMSVGAMMFIFGIVDRTSIQEQFSFLMLPIWIGMATGGGGFMGLFIGLYNRRRGFVNLTLAPLLKAINVITIGLSLMAVLTYGSTLSFVCLRIENNIVYNNLPDDDPYKGKYHKLSKQPIPLDVYPSDDTLQGVFGTIIFLSMVEIFVGAIMMGLERDGMVVQTSSQPYNMPRVPVANVIIQGQPQVAAQSQPPPSKHEQPNLATTSTEQT